MLFHTWCRYTKICVILLSLFLFVFFFFFNISAEAVWEIKRDREKDFSSKLPSVVDACLEWNLLSRSFQGSFNVKCRHSHYELIVTCSSYHQNHFNKKRHLSVLHVISLISSYKRETNLFIYKSYNYICAKIICDKDFSGF